MVSIERFQQRQKELEAEYDLLSEKISRLRKDRILETDTSNRFKLSKHIEEAEQEREAIEREIEAAVQAINAEQAQKDKEEPQLFKTSEFLVLHNLSQPDYERFVGRETEREQMRQLLSSKSRHFVITIDGIGGIGKSALALEIADSYRRDFDKLPHADRFDAIIWTTAKQTMLTGEGIITRSRSLRTLEDIYTTIAITLQQEDIPHARTDEQGDLIRRALTQQRTLLIIDNLETVDDERVLTFIREVPDPTKVIVTTRHRLDIAYPIRLVGMPEQDAMQLIGDAAKLKGVTLTDDEYRRLYQRTGGVPLAIVWSIAQMGFGYGVEAVLTRLGQPTSDIARFCFEVAIESIKNKPAQKLLLALSVFATDASREALGQITNLPELDRDDGLIMLEKLSLMNKSGGRFSLLPLTKSFADAYLKETPEIETSLRLAFLRYFQELCQKFGGEQWHLYHNLDADLKNIQLALEWTYQLRMWHEVGDFVINLVEFLDRRALWKELVEYSEMAVEAGREIHDKSLIMKQKIYGLGWLKAFRFRDFEAGIASIEEGKRLAIELGDEREYAKALRDEGHIYRKFGEYDKAKPLLQKSLDIWQKLGDQRWEIRTLGTLGGNEREQGNLDEAFAYYTEALRKSRETGDVEQIALNLRRLGALLWRERKFEEVRSHIQEALAIYTQLNIPHDFAYTCLILARIEYALGNADEAKKQVQRAYEIFSTLRMKKFLKETTELLEALSQSPADPTDYLTMLENQEEDHHALV
jgi:LuxR family glucitol operon transcriptional activator